MTGGVELPVWVLPQDLPLAEIFGPDWSDDQIRAEFLSLVDRWNRIHGIQVDPGVPPQPGRRYLPGQWAWKVGARHVTPNGHPYPGGRDDELEVDITLAAFPRFPAGCVVTADLWITCQCWTEHGTHEVQEVQRYAETPSAGLEAFSHGLDDIEDWLASSKDPAWWRARLGAPTDVGGKLQPGQT